MPRPKHKTDLLNLALQNRQQLLDFIDRLPEVVLHGEFPPSYMNRNVRDVLAHLHHWHLMMQTWHQVGMSGQKPDMPAKGYTWKDTSKLNREIWEKYQKTPYAEVRSIFEASAQAVYQLIESHSNEELFEKKRYHWTGSTSLGAYLISATSSHYDWALKLIKKHKKAYPLETS